MGTVYFEKMESIESTSRKNHDKMRKADIMGELKDLMTGNYNDKFVFMTDEQKGEEFYKKANALSEDLLFLQLMVNRSSTSGFRFEITPKVNQMDFKFWHKLFHGSYAGHIDAHGVRNMLSDYYLAKNMFAFLSGETVESETKWTIETCRAVKTYFKSMHDLNIEDYTGCFIGCSRVCDEIIDILCDMYS